MMFFCVIKKRSLYIALYTFYMFSFTLRRSPTNFFMENYQIPHADIVHCLIFTVDRRMTWFPYDKMMMMKRKTLNKELKILYSLIFKSSKQTKTEYIYLLEPIRAYSSQIYDIAKKRDTYKKCKPFNQNYYDS